jgi:hypothetical protein
MFSKSFLFIFIISMQTFAYVPTVESLFRNSANKVIDSNTVVLEIKSRKIVDENDEEEKNKFVSYKYIFNVEKRDKHFALQLGYAGDFSQDTLQNLKFWPSYHFKDLVNLSAEQKVIYALFASQALNDGRMMLHFLRERGSQAKFNKEVLNEEQKLLLEKYMYYLSVKNQDTEVNIINVKNPLESEDSERQEQINEILKQPFYQPSPMVKFFRAGKELKWKVGDVFEGIFDYESHHLERLVVPLMDSKIVVDLRNPILFKGKYEMPSHIYLTLQNGEKYHIEVVNYYRISEDRSKYLNRVQKVSEKSRRK